MRLEIHPLIEQLNRVTGETDRGDEGRSELAPGLPEVDRLQKIPGVGTITALGLALPSDELRRFRRNRKIAPLFGLRPTVRETSDTSHIVT